MTHVPPRPSEQPRLLRCAAHPNCTEPVVAIVGLPSTHAMRVCERGFYEFVDKTKKTLGWPMPPDPPLQVSTASKEYVLCVRCGNPLSGGGHGPGFCSEQR